MTMTAGLAAGVFQLVLAAGIDGGEIAGADSWRTPSRVMMPWPERM